jgi:hypothetical protein
MSSWRDFALRGFDSREATDGIDDPERICGADNGFA